MSGPGHERYAVPWNSMWTSSLLTQGTAGEISARTSLAMFTLASGCSVSSIEGEPGKEVEGLASLGEQKRDDHKSSVVLWQLGNEEARPVQPLRIPAPEGLFA